MGITTGVTATTITWAVAGIIAVSTWVNGRGCRVCGLEEGLSEGLERRARFRVGTLADESGLRVSGDGAAVFGVCAGSSGTDSTGEDGGILAGGGLISGTVT